MEELQRQQEEKLKKLRESHDTSRREKEVRGRRMQQVQ